MCDAGVCIDLRGMKQHRPSIPISASRAPRAARTWGEFDAATQEHGLAVTGGRVSTTGIAGLALGSGSGWLERKFGFVCDNLIEAEVVTADGRIVTASDDENADLFWGLRGGGGNFGIVTAFHLRVHPLGPIVLGGMLHVPGRDGAEISLPFYRDFMRDAPDEVGSGLAFITAPPEEFVPEPVRGQPVIGDRRAATPVRSRTARSRCKPLREFGLPASTWSARCRTSRCSSCSTPPHPKGMQNYWTADFYDDLPDEAIDVLVERGTQPGLAADADHPGARRRRDRARRRGSDRVRSAQRAPGTSTTCRCGPTRPTPRRTSPTPASSAAR